MKYFFKALGVFALMTSLSYGEFTKATNGEHVTITGKVSDVKADSFKLNFQGKTILVEMDDYSSWIKDGFKLANGDDVIVSGKIDKDFMEKKKVEAGSVYVKNIDTYFYASIVDEEDLTYFPTAYGELGKLPEGVAIDLQGKITQVRGREFTVDTGLRRVTIDTSTMGYNPMDDSGFTLLDVGDRVRVSGKVEDNVFDTREVAASYVRELPKLI